MTRRRLADLGADDAEVLAMSAWTPTQGIAASFRDGPVFLAGDAAHVVTPFGGLGVNTGMADAFDLGWKLDAVLRGWGGPRLLDSYDIERRGAAMDLLAYQGVDFSTEPPARRNPVVPPLAEIDPEMWRDSADGRAARRRVGEEMAAARAEEYHKPGVDLGTHYAGSPVVWTDGGAPPDRTGPADYTPTSTPGDGRHRT
ncbi:MAG: FAD-dependent monooxygenase [Acidimicrobiales bacterium]